MASDSEELGRDLDQRSRPAPNPAQRAQFAIFIPFHRELHVPASPATKYATHGPQVELAAGKICSAAQSRAKRRGALLQRSH
jgi:hypothetical protein